MPRQENRRHQNAGTIWINARFLDRPTTGVERVARQVLSELKRQHLDEHDVLRTTRGPMRVRLIAPHSDSPSTDTCGFPVLREGRLRGHLWEQLELPWLTQGDWLLSLCNTGPVCKRRQWIFLHDAQPFAIPENFSPSIRYTYPWLYRLCAWQSRRVLVNSEFTRAELIRYTGACPSKFSVCHLGSDHSQPQTQNKYKDKDKDPLLPAEPYVLAFASDNPNKNAACISSALELMGADAPLCLVVGGSAASTFNQAGKQTNSATARMRQVGRVSDAELSRLLQGAMALLYPSRYEGFGLPPLEAMRNNCPVVVARTGALPETAGPAALYCDPNRPATLAAAIQRVAESKSLRKVMRSYGKSRARLFTWSRCTQTIVATIQSDLQIKQTSPQPVPAIKGPALSGPAINEASS